MKLKDFPLVMRAFKEIEYDNGGTRARELLPEAEVTPYWLIPFRTAENTFRRCGGLTAHVIEEFREREEYDASTELWQIVASPVNEDDWIVFKHLGIGETQGWITGRLLYEFFDGELTVDFTGPRRPL